MFGEVLYSKCLLHGRIELYELLHSSLYLSAVVANLREYEEKAFVFVVDFSISNLLVDEYISAGKVIKEIDFVLNGFG